MASVIKKILPGLDELLQYERSWLKGDVAAGLSVAAVALPVGIAYADLAGVPAVIGMYSAIFPLFAYALFGSSRQLMTGPDAATCIIVAASLGHLAAGDPIKYQMLMVALTLCTGLVYIVAGLFRLGFIANFLSLPILTGFLNGIALIIIIGQLKKLFGVELDSNGFLPELMQFIQQLGNSHFPTLSLGLGLIVCLLILKKIAPKLPAALIVVILGIVLVQLLNLDRQGVKVLGTVPAGMPSLFSVPELAFSEFKLILGDAMALTLVSFTSGILTAKSFAQRNNYEVDANQELIAFGACNLASGAMQGFPVTGADSRTAVNNAMGGKSQMVGIIAGLVMLLVLFFLTEPLAFVPISALAAVIMVSAFGLFDINALKELYSMNRTEFIMSLLTTLGVLILGALPGVILAVLLSLILLLTVASKPTTSVLGRVETLKSYHSVEDFSDAATTPGVLVYRFEADIVFFNADYFKQDLLAKVKQESDLQWVILDASPVNIVDTTAVKKVREVLVILEDKGIQLFVTHQRRNVQRFFADAWVSERRESTDSYRYPTTNEAIKAFNAQAG